VVILNRVLLTQKLISGLVFRPLWGWSKGSMKLFKKGSVIAPRRMKKSGKGGANVWFRQVFVRS